jgi:glyoxylase-like metal-dependent hydrolase (beta-lactamase superfamily II)
LKIHTLRSLIANLYLIETNGILVLVDSGFYSAAPRVLDAIRQLGYTPDALKLIVLTHGHVDHIGSAARLKRLTNAPIALHRADAAKAQAGKHPLPKGRGTAGRALASASHALKLAFPYEAFTPDLLLEDGQSLHEAGLAARVVATPGHTLGSISLDLGEGELIIGDAVINQIRVGMPLYGEDNVLAYDSARKLLGLNPRIMHSGHGKAFSGAELARYFELKGLSTERLTT